MNQWNADVNPLHIATYSVTFIIIISLYMKELEIINRYCLACSFSIECQFKPITSTISCMSIVHLLMKPADSSRIRLIISEDFILTMNYRLVFVNCCPGAWLLSSSFCFCVLLFVDWLAPSSFYIIMLSVINVSICMIKH